MNSIPIHIFDKSHKFDVFNMINVNEDILKKIYDVIFVLKTVINPSQITIFGCLVNVLFSVENKYTEDELKFFSSNTYFGISEPDEVKKLNNCDFYVKTDTPKSLDVYQLNINNLQICVFSGKKKHFELLTSPFKLIFKDWITPIEFNIESTKSLNNLFKLNFLMKLQIHEIVNVVSYEFMNLEYFYQTTTILLLKYIIDNEKNPAISKLLQEFSTDEWCPVCINKDRILPEHKYYFRPLCCSGKQKICLECAIKYKFEESKKNIKCPFCKQDMKNYNCGEFDLMIINPFIFDTFLEQYKKNGEMNIFEGIRNKQIKLTDSKVMLKELYLILTEYKKPISQSANIEPTPRLTTRRTEIEIDGEMIEAEEIVEEYEEEENEREDDDDD